MDFGLISSVSEESGGAIAPPAPLVLMPMHVNIHGFMDN